jgi:hypothetical protein
MAKEEIKRWITAREASERLGIATQTLANWRTEDARRGFIEEGRPIWRRFGASIRYYLDGEDTAPTRDLSGLPPAKPRGRWARRQPTNGRV